MHGARQFNQKYTIPSDSMRTPRNMADHRSVTVWTSTNKQPNRCEYFSCSKPFIQCNHDFFSLQALDLDVERGQKFNEILELDVPLMLLIYVHRRVQRRRT